MNLKESKDLTVCLLTLGRNNFTERFVKYYNYSGIPYKLIIGDGFKEKLPKKLIAEIKNNSKIRYYYFKNEYDLKKKIYYHNKFYTRILFCLNKVKTKYVKFIFNDDMLLIKNTNKCIQFLNKNSFFDCAGGNGLDFEIDKKVYGKIININEFYTVKDIQTNISKISRIKKYLKKNFDTWHLIFKTNKIKKIFTVSSKFNNDPDFKDNFHEILVRYYCKMKYFNFPIFLHESHHEGNFGSIRGNTLLRMSDVNFYSKLNIFFKSIDKVLKIKNKNIIKRLYFKYTFSDRLKLYNNKSYHSLRDIILYVINNLKTKLKIKKSLNSFLKLNIDKDIKTELVNFQKFIINNNDNARKKNYL
jgi:glycosyltransferase domain-containing protein